MADNAGTPAGEGGSNSGTAPISIEVPTDFEQNEAFKPFFVEADGAKKFDFQALTKSYLDTKQALPVVPETADAYKAEVPDGWDQADLKLQREMARQAGMTQAQYEAMVKFDLARMSRAAESVDADIAKAKERLVSEWKSDYEKNLGMAKKAADAVFGPEFSQRVDIGNDPQIIKGLYLIATKMREDTFRAGGTPAGDLRPTGNDGKPRLKFPSMGD
jgi:hypothetical protein